MNRKALFVALAALAAPVAAQEGTAVCDLRIDYGSDLLAFTVTGADAPFFGGVIASLNPQLHHYLHLLPPLLTDFVVLGVGEAAREYVVTLDARVVPAGVTFYAQGLVFDGVGICGSPVRDFVVDPHR